MAPSARPRSWGGFAAVLVALSVLLSAWQGISAAGSGGSTTNGSGQISATPTPTSTPAVLDVFPADLTTGFAPNIPVTVKASSGTLGTVTLVGAKGESVAGQAGPD